MANFTKAAQEQATEIVVEQKAAKRGRPCKEKTKSAIIHIHVHPELKENLEKIAKIKATNLTDIVTTLSEEYIAQNEDAIAFYDNVLKPYSKSLFEKN